MVVVDDAAVRADRDIDAGLFKVLVPRLADLDQRGRLAAADALLFAGDADRAAADADLDEVSAAFGEEEEAVPVDDVAGADLDRIAIVGADPFQRPLLPLGVPLGGVDAEDVRARLDQRGDPLFVVAGVDAGPDDIPLVGVEQLEGVGFMGIVVLAEGEVFEVAFRVDQRQGV